MTIYKYIFIILFALFSTNLIASEVIADPREERVSVAFRNLKICHQHQWRNLTVGIDFLGDNVDIENLRLYVREFLNNYTQEDDFWEVMNVKLVKELSVAFPGITLMESTLSLKPDQVLIYPRSSTVKFEKGAEILKERFSFTKRNYLICQETFHSLDLHVAFDFKDNPVPADYPDYRWVDDAMTTFFKEHPVSLSEWKELKPLLEEYLLSQFASLASISVNVSAAN